MSAVCEQFKALADPTRLRIVVLLTAGELCVCDILAVLHLPQSTVSRQLAILKSAGLVADRRAGRWVHYRLQANRIEQAVRPIFVDHLAKQPPHCDDLGALAAHRKLGECES